MNHIERVLTTIDHGEPDKVPKGELGIAEEVIRGLLGHEINDIFEDLVTAEKMLKMDLVNMWSEPPSPQYIGKDEKGRDIYRNAWGNESVSTGISNRIIKPAIEKIVDIYSYEPPSPDLYNFDHIRKWAECTDFFVYTSVQGVFDFEYMLMGFEDFLIATKTNEKAIKLLVKKVSQFAIDSARKAIQAGAHLIIIADDLAHNTGTFLAPRTLRDLFFPYLAEEVKEIKKLGVPVFLHSDGNLNEILDDIVEMGFDGLQSLQPSANMDLARIKKRYGDRICLMGNIDIDYTLPFGNAAEVKEAVIKALRIAGPGGGYILSSSNVLTRDVPAENAKTMYETAERYGKYPLRCE